MVKLKTGRVILPAIFTTERFFVGAEPNIYFGIPVSHITDVFGFIFPVPSAHVFFLIGTSFFLIFIGHPDKTYKRLFSLDP